MTTRQKERMHDDAAAALLGASIAPVPVTLRRRTIVRLLAGIVVLLILLSLAGQIAKYEFGRPTVLGLVSLFYVDFENSAPTWYSSMALALAALLFGMIGFAARAGGLPFVRHWFGLSLILWFLSLDEVASIHERTIEPLQRITGYLPGAWQPTWVIPAIIAVAVVGISYLRFLWHLRPAERLQVIVAGVLFVGGAVGIEMVGGALFDTTVLDYKETLSYALLVHVEEVLEMAGVIVLVDFLLRRLAGTGQFSLNFAH